MEDRNYIGTEILRQLGGNRFIVMTGAKHFYTNGNDLGFTIGRNRSKANKVQIILNGDDTYTVLFKKFTPERMRPDYTWTESKCDEISRHVGIYCDQLQELFTRETGLYTSLACRY